MNSFIKSVFDFLLPRLCVSCNNQLSLSETVICCNCLKITEFVTPDLIARLNNHFLTDKYISGFSSLLIFRKDTPVQALIHSLKYHGRFQNGIFLGRLLGKSIGNKLAIWDINIIIPVPLHKLKEAERGYNQSFYIAKGISAVTGIEICSNFLKRIKNTGSQTFLTKTQRIKNVRDAFNAGKSKKLFNKNVLLVDDVCTSGSTFMECAKALSSSGVSKIYAASASLVNQPLQQNT